MNGKRPYGILIVPLLLLCLGISPAGAAILVQCPTDTNGDGISDDPNVSCRHLAAGDGFSLMADGKGQYIFSFAEVPPGTPEADVIANFTGRARSPAPTLVVDQGQELYLSLSNVGMVMRPDLFDAHSVHWHGFINAASVFDGVPEVSPAAAPLATQPYYYKAAKEGTFFYHCHVEASEHMQMGMIGNLWVRPSQNGTLIGGFTEFLYNDGDGSTGYHVAVPIQLTTFDPRFHDASLAIQALPFATMKDDYFMINGRGYPDTINPGDITNNALALSGGVVADYVAQSMNARIVANAGDTIALRVSNVSTTDLITLATTLGVPMKVVARGAELLRNGANDTSYQVSVLNIGGGQAYDVIIDTTGVSAGAYFIYTTNLNFLSNGGSDPDHPPADPMFPGEGRGGIMTEVILN